MAVELKVPEVGESITEVEIGDWLKSEGEKVHRDDAVVMIETDKVTVELPAPVTGVVSKILVQKGETATVGQIIGYMEEGAAQTTSKDSGPSSGGSKERSEPKAESKVSAPVKEARDDAPAAKESSGNDRDGAPTPKERGSSPPPGGALMPAARRALHEAGLDASEVQGSGPSGRILKEDVERVSAERSASKPSEQASKEQDAPKRGASKPSERPSKGRASSDDREEDVVGMTPMRRRIAERLVEAQQTAALLTTFNEADMSAVMALRKQYQPVFQERYGIKLGFMSFFVKAAVDALKLVPAVNAEVRGSDIIYKNYYDIGVAVGGGKGLVVPVIRDVDTLGFAEVELTIADFGKRAQGNRIKLDELQGGTFTISNGGVYGSMLSTPIVNPPQSGILGLHAIQERPVARDGQVVIRPMMYLALTYDHRLVDGREAVTFLKRIKETIEDPTRMLLEV
jgi:2-oxoglutarate dehydrogenase E2 component (dihydrolipoamide succinyltransferase)